MNYQTFLMVPPVRRISTKKVQLLFVGDSLTWGTGTTGTGYLSSGSPVMGNMTYPKQCIADINNSLYTPSIYGFPGWRFTDFTNDQGSTFNTHFDFVHNDVVLCAVWFGANDEVVPGTDENVIYAAMQTLTSALKAGGAKVILLTAINRMDGVGNYPANNAIRKAYNVMLRATPLGTYFDALCDLGTTVLDADDAPMNDAWFADPDVDGFAHVHLNDTGAGIVAAAVASTVTSYINSLP